jgi:thermopsin
MKANRSTVLRGMLWIFVILLVTSGGAVGSATAHAGSPAAAPPRSPALPATDVGAPVAASTNTAIERLLDAARSGGAPRWAVFLPDLNAIGHETRRDGHIEPLYSGAPAPMGVSDLGLREQNATLVPYTLNTSSIQGTIDLNRVAPFYLDDAGPFTFGIQLNTVLANVTVANESVFSFWTQNVVEYSTDTHALTFIDNIWNFSGAELPAQTLYSGDGQVSGNAVYYAIGPTVTIAPPFRLNLYTNTTVVDERDTVFFNYTLTNSTGHTVNGSYDEVEFNSASVNTSAAHYEINGFNYTPLGLPYDAELTLGGPGGGSTQDLQNINATMQLQVWNSTSRSYSTVPSAYSSGTDTGETVSGVAEWYSAGPVPTVHLGPGPSFIEGLWNAGGLPGEITFQGTLTPSNAWTFITNSSTYNQSVAQWSPSPPNGDFDFQLAPGSYSTEFMLADHTPLSYTFSAGSSIVAYLPLNYGEGVYTPLMAWNNAQLPAISSQGNGTLENPFVLDNGQYTSLRTEFSQINDFFFPVFFGELLANTSEYVAIDTPPSFQIYYNPYMVNLSLMQLLGLPTWNDLQIEMFGVSHASVLNAAAISGWFYYLLGGFSLANVLIWNSSQILVSSNTFYNLGSSLMVYDSPNVTVWGNYFLPSGTAVGGAFMNFGYPMDVVLYTSGDLVYNNYFASPVEIPAYTPLVDIYDGAFQIYSDLWNVTPQSAANVRMVNGYPLFGNIFGGTDQGGNYWWNYGLPTSPYGTLPYNDSGAIVQGGDYDPLTAPLFSVTFSETGLPAGASWTVVLNGTAGHSVEGTIGFYVPSGSYGYVITSDGGYSVTPGSGQVTVGVEPMTIPVEFVTTFEYPLTFELQGVPSDTSWALSVAGAVYGSNLPVQTVQLVNGSYPYAVTFPNYVPLQGTAVVDGAGSMILLTAVPLNATLQGSLSAPSATLTIDQHPVDLASNSFQVSLMPGVHALEATAPGYYPYFNNVSLGPNASLTLVIRMTAVPSTSGPVYFNNTTGPISMALVWGIVAGLIVLAIAIVLGAALVRSDGSDEDERRPPSAGSTPANRPPDANAPGATVHPPEPPTRP